MSAIIPISRSKSLSKPLRNSLRNSLRNPNMRTKLHTLGSAKSIVVQNGQPLMDSIHWDIDYDGSKATGKLDLQNQDHVSHYNVNLNNVELGPLLSTPSVPIPIDQRLRQSFGVDHTTMGSLINPSGIGSSFNDYVQPSNLFTPIGVSRRPPRRIDTLRKKYRLTPYPRNKSNSLRKRKTSKRTLTRINR